MNTSFRNYLSNLLEPSYVALSLMGYSLNIHPISPKKDVVSINFIGEKSGAIIIKRLNKRRVSIRYIDTYPDSRIFILDLPETFINMVRDY